MASRFIANLLLLGSGVLIRAFTQAYKQALVNAAKSGVAEETLANVRKTSRALTLEEARLILGVNSDTTWEEVMQKYQRLYENNERAGTFYLQSKVYRAKEALEMYRQQTGGKKEEIGNSTGETEQRQ